VGLVVVCSSAALFGVRVIVVGFATSLGSWFSLVSLVSLVSLISLLSWLVVSLFLLVLELTILNVVKSFLESIFDGEDLGCSLIQEVVDFRLGFGVGLEVILFKLDLGNSLLHLSDEITESLLSGLFSTIVIDSLGSFLG